MRGVAQALLVLLITVKLVLGSFTIYQLRVGGLHKGNDAIASEAEEEAGALSKDAVKGEGEKTELKELILKKAELREQEDVLARKQRELMEIKEEINQKIAELTRLRNEIRAQVAEKEAREEASLKHLIKAYSAMRPEKAASLIEKLDMAFATKLLSRMKPDAVGKILSHVDVEKAAKMTEGLAKQK